MNFLIGEIAKQFNLPTSTIRYYDSIGVIPSLKRNTSGIRIFDEKDMESLRVIECLKKSDMSMKEISVFMDWCKQGDSSLPQRREMFHHRKEVVEQKILELQNTLNLINFKCWYYDTAIKDGTEQFVKNMPVEEMPKEIQEFHRKTH